MSIMTDTTHGLNIDVRIVIRLRRFRVMVYVINSATVYNETDNYIEMMIWKVFDEARRMFRTSGYFTGLAD